MKRFALYFGIAAVLMVSCSIKEEDYDVPYQDDVIFYASFEQPGDEGTKVYANENMLLRWTSDDRVSIFSKLTYNQQYKFTGSTGDNAGGFRRVDSDEYVTGNTIPHVISVYPYQENTKISESETLSLTLPTNQHYAENTFGLGDNTMVSVSSDNVLQFKNIGGFLVLQLFGEGVSVSSISLRGNDNEIIAGKASVTMPLDGVPSVTMDNGETTMITLACSTPIKLGSTKKNCIDFWFVIPPITFSKGFTITVTDIKGRVFETATSKRITIERNYLSRMAPIEVTPTSRNNVIYYTTTDGNIITPYTLNGFQGDLISNEYIDERGVLTFSQDVTTVAPWAFYECSTLSSMTLPESVTDLGYTTFEGCTSLSSINIPEGVTKIGSWTFGYCESLTEVILPEQLTSIEYCAFASCTRLTTINLPQGITIIESYAFDGCANLTDVILPERLTTLEYGAFYGCSSFTSITLPERLTSIGEAAFSGCKGLVSINVLPKTPPTGGRNMFTSTNNCPIIVPSESIEVYLSAQYWKDYANRIQTGSLVHVESVVLDKTNIELNIGRSETLKATVLPDYATNKSVSWSSSNESVATVSSFGVVKGIGAGSATITVSTTDGGKTDYCNVAVVTNYTSTDFSKDGEVVLLHKATVGKGVNLILMGDGFVDKDMADGGLYDLKMSEAMDRFFSYEPYKSFKNRFNLYYVRVVSNNNLFKSEESDRRLSYEQGGSIGFRTSLCYDYAEKVPNPNNLPLKVAVIFNIDEYYARSFCSMIPAWGDAVAYILDVEENIICHELGGHGFALLADEYEENSGVFSGQNLLDQRFEDYGYGANVDWRNDPSTVKWARFLSDNRYSQEKIGIYEGAYLYSQGVYRPTENSVMRYHYRSTGKSFNAPSREQIYKTIMKYSEGSSWSYSYEAFVNADEAGRNQAISVFNTSTSYSPSRISIKSDRDNSDSHLPPVILDRKVKEICVDQQGKVVLIQ